MLLDDEALQTFLQAVRKAGMQNDQEIRVAVWRRDVIHLQVLHGGRMIQGYQLLADGTLYGPYVPPSSVIGSSRGNHA